MPRDFKRSHFGCRTCKIRKVKCDETLPSCRQCTATGRCCEGPSKYKSIFVIPKQSTQWRRPPPVGIASCWSNTPLPFNQPLHSPDLQAADQRALSFFTECAAPALGGEADRDFWRGYVPQLCHRSPMVKDAVLAISTLYEKPLKNSLMWPTSLDANFTQPQHLQAFKWYSQSLNAMSQVLHRPQNQEQLYLALTSCILFASIEIQQLNAANSMGLLKCGYNLLSKDSVQVLVDGDPFIRDVLLPIFIRQTIVLMLQGHSLPEGWLPTDCQARGISPASITSLRDARTQLFLLMLNGFTVVKEASVNQDVRRITDLRHEQSITLQKFSAWRKRLDLYISTTTTSSILLPAQARSLDILLIYYFVATIWLSACLHPSEMIYDDFTPEFQAILDHTQAIISHDKSTTVAYTFEMGVIPPLYFTGWRCRMPRIRRRALELLRKAPAQESLFHRDIAIWAVRKIIEIEEGLHSGDNIESNDGVIPSEDSRLRHAMVRWDGGLKERNYMQEKGPPTLVHSRWLLVEDENGQLREV